MRRKKKSSTEMNQMRMKTERYKRTKKTRMKAKKIRMKMTS